MQAIPLSRTQLKIAVLVLTVILLILFNMSGKKPKSGIQSEFESWVSNIEQIQQQGNPLSNSLVISLRSPMSEPPFEWTLKGGQTSTDTQLIRLLQLAREANIFAAAKQRELSRPLNQDEVEFEVRDAEKRFRIPLARTTVEHSSAAQNLLKLFEIYRSNQAQG